MKKRRLTALLIVSVLLALVLAGCGGSGLELDADSSFEAGETVSNASCLG